MRIVNVEPKDIYVTIEMSMKEVNMLLDALDNAEINIKKDTAPELETAINFLVDVFFKNLSKLSDEVKEN